MKLMMTFERKHREHKRSLEISLAIDSITSFLKSNCAERNVNILEFGSGDGFQIPYLQKIGPVVASDVYTSKNIKNMKNVNFTKCSITNTPFNKEQFDIIFSNHVFEHIEDKSMAFDELKRIGKPNCLYAFSVPTNIWLLLSIPAQYFNKLMTIVRKLSYMLTNNKIEKSIQNDNDGSCHMKTKKRKINKLLDLICPSEHGAYSGFVDCYRSFKTKKWRQLFFNNKFTIIKIQPLLLYAPSEFPIMPTTKLFNKLNVYSSVLFLMKKQEIK